jgi:hypothetical protein
MKGVLNTKRLLASPRAPLKRAWSATPNTSSRSLLFRSYNYSIYRLIANLSTVKDRDDERAGYWSSVETPELRKGQYLRKEARAVGEGTAPSIDRRKAYSAMLTDRPSSRKHRYFYGKRCGRDRVHDVLAKMGQSR